MYRAKFFEQRLREDQFATTRSPYHFVRRGERLAQHAADFRLGDRWKRKLRRPTQNLFDDARAIEEDRGGELEPGRRLEHGRVPVEDVDLQKRTEVRDAVLCPVQPFVEEQVTPMAWRQEAMGYQPGVALGSSDHAEIDVRVRVGAPGRKRTSQEHADDIRLLGEVRHRPPEKCFTGRYDLVMWRHW